MKLVIILALALSAISFSASINPTDSGEPQYLTDLLLSTEEKRLSAPKEFSHELEELAKQTAAMSQYQLCHFKFLQSYATSYRGEHEQATEVLLDLLTTCEDLRALIRINAMLANIYIIGGQFEKASFYIDEAIFYAEKTQDQTSKNRAYSAATIVYNLLEQYDLSQRYSRLMYKISPTDSNQCVSDYYKLNAQFKSSNASIDKEEITRIFDLCNASEQHLIAYFLILNYHRFQLNNYDNDLSVLNDIRNGISEIETGVINIQYKNLLALFYSVKAQVESKLSNSVDAIELANQSLQFNETIGDSEQYIIALKVLEQEALKANDYQKSYHFLKLKSEAEERIFDVNLSKQMAFMTVKHANLAKSFEIDQLSQQNELLELEKQLSNQKSNNQRLWIMFILSLFGLVLMWLVRMKKRHDYFKEVSEVDHLTKVLTRKAFEEQLTDMNKLSKSKNELMYLAIMDLDHFKVINDNHGHLTGDWVLKNVIYTCKELIQEGMIIGRLGGEEFGIAMRGFNQTQAIQRIEDMRQAIEHLDTTDSGYDIEVTASFGLTDSKTSGYTIPMLLTHADLALFVAKDNGRNRMVYYDKHDKTS